MLTLIETINRGMTFLFEFILWPFRGLDPIWALTFVSLLTGVLMVWIFGLASDQRKINQVRNRIRGNLFGVRLFQHNVKAVMRLQGRIFRDTLSYMRLSLFPLLVMLVPVLLILIQLNLFFSSRPLSVDERTLLKLHLNDELASVYDEIELQADAGVEIETPPVRISGRNEVAWRLRALEQGLQTITVTVNRNNLTKELSVESRWGPVSTLRTTSWLDLLLYPGEPALPPEAGVRLLEILPRPLELSVWGWKLNWLVVFFVLSIAFGFLFKKPLGVEI